MGRKSQHSDPHYNSPPTQPTSSRRPGQNRINSSSPLTQVGNSIAYSGGPADSISNNSLVPYNGSVPSSVLSYGSNPPPPIYTHMNANVPGLPVLQPPPVLPSHQTENCNHIPPNANASARDVYVLGKQISTTYQSLGNSYSYLQMLGNYTNGQ